MCASQNILDDHKSMIIDSIVSQQLLRLNNFLEGLSVCLYYSKFRWTSNIFETFWNHQLCSHWLEKMLRLRVYLEGFAHIAIALMMIQSSGDWARYIILELWSHAMMDDLRPDLKPPTIFVSQKTRTPLEKPCSQARCCPEISSQHENGVKYVWLVVWLLSSYTILLKT